MGGAPEAGLPSLVPALEARVYAPGTQRRPARPAGRSYASDAFDTLRTWGLCMRGGAATSCVGRVGPTYGWVRLASRFRHGVGRRSELRLRRLAYLGRCACAAHLPPLASAA